MSGTPLDDVPERTLWRLINNACYSADSAAIDVMTAGGTGHERTKAAVEGALKALIANGLITVTPIDEWPEYFVMDAPYTRNSE